MLAPSSNSTRVNVTYSTTALILITAALTLIATRANRSDTLRALAAELAGAPEEERAAVAGLDSAAALRTRAKLEARAAAEEDMFVRVPLSKDEAKRLRQQRRAGMSGAGERAWPGCGRGRRLAGRDGTERILLVWSGVRRKERRGKGTRLA